MTARACCCLPLPRLLAGVDRECCAAATARVDGSDEEAFLPQRLQYSRLEDVMRVEVLRRHAVQAAGPLALRHEAQVLPMGRAGTGGEGSLGRVGKVMEALHGQEPVEDFCA